MPVLFLGRSSQPQPGMAASRGTVADFLNQIPNFSIIPEVRSKSDISERKMTMDQKPAQEREVDVDVLVQEPAKVILFNDEVHTFDEVIGQLIKALRCDSAKAEALTWEVHNTGKSAVFEGPMDDCVRISGVLEEIELHTQIEV